VLSSAGAEAVPWLIWAAKSTEEKPSSESDLADWCRKAFESITRKSREDQMQDLLGQCREAKIVLYFMQNK